MAYFKYSLSVPSVCGTVYHAQKYKIMKRKKDMSRTHLEEGVLQDTLHTTQGLDDICAVVIQIPELAVVPLMRPPEGVLLEHLELLEVGAHSPPLVIGQSVPVLLEQSVDAGDAPVPAVLQILHMPLMVRFQPKFNCVTIKTTVNMRFSADWSAFAIDGQSPFNGRYLSHNREVCIYLEDRNSCNVEQNLSSAAHS